MKRLSILVLLITVALATPLFGAPGTSAKQPNAVFGSGAPTTTNNGDSCDIGVTPAATLLLPYFEIDPNTQNGVQTIFTVTNVSRFPQIAHVTLWTAWSTPVLDFNLYLTGYDVQAINLFDVIVRGLIAPTTGAVYRTVPGTVGPNVVGATPLASGSTNNPNLTAATATTCANIPGQLPGDGFIALNVLLALVNGRAPLLCSNAAIGPNNGNRAIGYVTIDVAAECTNYLPTDPLYYTSTNGILYDNVLIGDYAELTGTQSFGAMGNPMVHIRAIPEGGPGGSAPGTNLPFTFYNRYSNAGTAGNPGLDRRQPLPSQWAARWIGGGVSSFSTSYKIWREGITGPNSCPGTVNSAIAVTNTIMFDERENSFGFGTNLICSPFCTAGGLPGLPESSRAIIAGGTVNPNFPPSIASGDVGGWTYMNLSSGGRNAAGTTAASGVLTASRPGFGTTAQRTTTQNWVIISMFAQGILSVDMDAAWLGNGCTAAPANGAPIGPSATYNGTTTVLVCPPGATCVGAPYGPPNPTP
jgi:hypothetical protein